MKPRPTGSGGAQAQFWCALVFVATAHSAAHARDLPLPSDHDEPTKLPDFEVHDTRVGAYGAGEATSTTRVSIPVHDLAQSVSVVTRELLDDTQGLRLVDVARFATPIVENWNGGGDWYSIRGLRTVQRFIDGVQVGAQGNSSFSNLSNVERLEIVKGPNAVLVPGADAGGRMNLITKSPKFEPFTRLSLRARSYLGNEVSLDANHVLHSNQSAARLVATYWDSDGYFHRQFRRGWLVAPSFVHRFSPRSELIAKLEILENKESTLMGVGIDPAVGTRVGGYARKHPLLPRDNQWPPFDEIRSRRETRFTSELRFPVGDRVAARLWLMADHVFFVTPTPGGARHAAGLQGQRHPLTGEWEPFKSFEYATDGTVTIRDLQVEPTNVFNRPRTTAQERYDELHFKNDYAFEYEIGSTGSATTILGLSANWQWRVESRAWAYARPPLDQFIDGRPVASGGDELFDRRLRTYKDADQRDAQVFAYQRLHLWRDRLIVSGGVAGFYGVLERLDRSGQPRNEEPVTRNAVVDWNCGAVYRPRPEISLFAGYNRVGGVLPVATAAGEFTTDSFKVGVGAQLEFGVKTSWLGGRITTSAAWFDLKQDNVPTFNPLSTVQGSRQPRYFYFDLANRGWEVEGNALITPSFELVGNFTRMRMRDSYGVALVMVPDAAGAVFAKYTIREGRWKGLGVSFGADYVSRLPGPSTGDNQDETPFTVAGVRNQPSFYLAPRTLVQAGVSYASTRWKLAVVVHNLTNKDYIRAAATRLSMEPGEPRNWSATLELRW